MWKTFRSRCCRRGCMWMVSISAQPHQVEKARQEMHQEENAHRRTCDGAIDREWPAEVKGGG